MKIRFYLLLILVFLPSCLKKSSRSYDCSRAAYENVMYKYDREMEVFEAMHKAKNREEKLRFARELKDEILLKNEAFNEESRSGSWFGKKSETENYPFMQYKMNLDRNIRLLENAKQKLYWKNEGLAKSVQNLIDGLDKLRRYIVLHGEYSRERKMLERRKILDVEKTATKKAKKKANRAKKPKSKK